MTHCRSWASLALTVRLSTTFSRACDNLNVMTLGHILIGWMQNGMRDRKGLIQIHSPKVDEPLEGSKRCVLQLLFQTKRFLLCRFICPIFRPEAIRLNDQREKIWCNKTQGDNAGTQGHLTALPSSQPSTDNPQFRQEGRGFLAPGELEEH